MPGSSPGVGTHALPGGDGVAVVSSAGVVVRIPLTGAPRAALAVVVAVVTPRPLQAPTVSSPLLVAGVVLGVAALVAAHHHMTSRPRLPRQVAGLGLPSVGQRLCLQLQVEAGGVLGRARGGEGRAAGGNNREAGPATSQA